MVYSNGRIRQFASFFEFIPQDNIEIVLGPIYLEVQVVAVFRFHKSYNWGVQSPLSLELPQP